LEKETKAASHLLQFRPSEGSDVDPVNQDTTSVWPQKSCHVFQDDAFAGAAPADQSKDFSFAYFAGHPSQHPDAIKRSVEVFNLDHRYP